MGLGRERRSLIEVLHRNLTPGVSNITKTLEPEFVGSISAEAVGFFRCGKNPQAYLPSEGK
jgi:hypothetical protein